MASWCCSAGRCGAWCRDVTAHGVMALWRMVSWRMVSCAAALRALTDGKMPVKCIPGRLAMARLRPDAFPGGNPWQFFHSMYPKRGLGRERGGLRGKICAPCIQNELALARYARHASEMPRKSPSEDTPREDLARKGPFSLHGPLESCTARRSCHPASANHPSARNPCTAHAPPQRQSATRGPTAP